MALDRCQRCAACLWGGREGRGQTTLVVRQAPAYALEARPAGLFGQGRRPQRLP